MEKEIGENAVKGRQVIESLRILKCKDMNMEVKWRQRNSIVLPTLIYASET